MTAFPGFLPYAVGGWLFLVGLYGVVTSRNLIHQVVCLSVVQASTYVVILAVGFRTGAAAPVFYDIPSTVRAVDPVVAALTLTDVVVEATVTSVLLALVVQAQRRFGTLDPERITPLRG
ncbi:MAG: cation:proton antiporter subunit C [Candidatus Dormibacterales bacterium]